MPERAGRFDSPQLHRARKCPLSRSFVVGPEGGRFPHRFPQASDQGKCSRNGRGNPGGTPPPSTRTLLAKAQVSGDRPTATSSEGGKRRMTTSEATRTEGQISAGSARSSASVRRVTTLLARDA